MRKLILAGLTFVFAITLSFAQEVNPEEKAQEVITTLTEKLSLTEEQQTPIYAIVLEHTQAKYAVKADASIEEAAKKEQLAQIANASNEKVKELLTEEQKPLFEAWVAEKEAEKQAKEEAEAPVPVQNEEG